MGVMNDMLTVGAFCRLASENENGCRVGQRTMSDVRRGHDGPLEAAFFTGC